MSEKIQVSNREQTGTVGLKEVEADFGRLGWGTEPNKNNDVGSGIDLFLIPRDENLVEPGWMLTAQVKAGDSWFSDPVEVDCETSGWFFRESNHKHLNYWLNQILPHLIVLRDLKTRTSYWVHVTAAAVQKTGKGWKILVPKAQRVDEDSREHLFRVAAEATASLVALEGSAWTGRDSMGEQDKWRCALIAPRLLAPHPNAGVAKPVGPAEGAALMVQMRAHDYERFASSHASVPTLEESAEHAEWGYRFVAALHGLQYEGQTTRLVSAFKSAEVPEQMAAAAVALACGLASLDKHGEAAAVLRDLLQADVLNPLDQAWARLQLGRFLAELGEMDEALELTLQAQTHLTPLQDVVARGLLAAAAANWWLLAGPLDADVAELIRRVDARVTWWRWQYVQGALADYLEEDFKRWSGNKAVTLMRNDPTVKKLLAAATSADFAGDHGANSSTKQLLARYELMTAHGNRDDQAAARVVDNLRRYGDESAVEQSVRRLWRSGPLGAIRKATDAITEAQWTRTSSLANLRLWAASADVMSPEAATAAFRFCFDALSDPDHLFHRRARRGFIPWYELLKTISSLLPVLDPRQHEEISAWLLAELGKRSPEGLALQTFTEVCEAVNWEVLDQRAHARWVGLAIGLEDPASSLSSLVLEHLVTLGQEDAKEHLIHLAQGSLAPLIRCVYLGLALDADTIASQRAALERQISVKIGDAKTGRHGFGGPNVCYALAYLNVEYPDGSRWDPVLDFLEHPAMQRSDKQDTCRYLAHEANRLPEPVKERIASNLDKIERAMGWIARIETKRTADIIVLGLRVGALSENDVREAIVSMAMSREVSDRRDAMTIIRHVESTSVVPEVGVGLLADPADDVREAAAGTIAGAALRSDSIVLRQAVVSGLNAAGAGLQASILRELLSYDSMPSWLTAPIEALLEHPSNQVRKAAGRLLTENAPRSN